jgi:hypothetical protein
MSKEISFLKVPEVTETMAPEIKFPPNEQFEVKLENNDHYAVITVRDNKKWRKCILDQLLESWIVNLQEVRFRIGWTQGGGRGRGRGRGGGRGGGRGRGQTGGRGGGQASSTEEPTEEPTEKSILHQYFKDGEQKSWASQKTKWEKFNVFFEKFEDLIKKVERDLLEDFKYIDMCWDYYLLTENCQSTSLRSEMDMCKNNCNVHVKIHFKKSGEEMRDLLQVNSSDGSSCLTILKQTLPTITTKIQQIYPEEDIFVFIPLTVMSTFHHSKNTIDSYYDTTDHQDVIDQADEIWLELERQRYEFFMDFIHSRGRCNRGKTCPVFVTRKNPFIVHLKPP